MLYVQRLLSDVHTMTVAALGYHQVVCMVVRFYICLSQQKKSAHILTQQKKELSGAAVQPLDLLAKLSGLISLSLC
jgi:hypothetical protein